MSQHRGNRGRLLAHWPIGESSLMETKPHHRYPAPRNKLGLKSRVAELTGLELRRFLACAKALQPATHPLS
jgi:hypothetical protein